MNDKSVHEFLADDHREIDHLLDNLEELFDSGDPPAILYALDLFWARLAMHIRAEHLHIFPHLIEASAALDVVNASATLRVLAGLRDDHNFFMRELVAGIQLLRCIVAAEESGGQPDLAGLRERIGRVHRKLAEHNETEESAIYPLVRKLLANAERSLLLNVERELSELPPRFSKTAGGSRQNI